MRDDESDDDLYTADEVTEMLSVVVLKATARDRARLAAFEAALRVAELAGAPVGLVRKAVDPERPRAAAPDPVFTPDDDADPDDTDVYVPDGDDDERLTAAAALLAAVQEAEHALNSGEDGAAVLDALGRLQGDPDAVRDALGLVAKAGKRAPTGGVSIGGKDYRGGQFIPAEVLANATKEEKEAVENGEGAKPAKKPRKPSQFSPETVAKREKKVANRKTAMELVYKLRDTHARGDAVSADDLHALVPHLSTLTHEELSNVRTQLFRMGASFGGTRKLQDRANQLADWARKAALDARMDEQGFSEADKEAGKRAVGVEEPTAPVANEATPDIANAAPAEPDAPQAPPATGGATGARAAEPVNTGDYASVRAIDLATGRTGDKVPDGAHAVPLGGASELRSSPYREPLVRVPYEAPDGTVAHRDIPRNTFEKLHKDITAAGLNPAEHLAAALASGHGTDAKSSERVAAYLAGRPNGGGKPPKEPPAAAPAPGGEPGEPQHIGTHDASGLDFAVGDDGVVRVTGQTAKHAAALRRAGFKFVDSFADDDADAPMRPGYKPQKYWEGTLDHAVNLDVPRGHDIPGLLGVTTKQKVSGKRVVTGAQKPTPTPATPPAKTQQDIAAEVTARRRAKGPRGGADDAKPSEAEVAAASQGAKPKPTVPAGHALVAELPGGAVVTEAPGGAGNRTTRFAPGEPERQAKRLAPALARALEESQLYQESQNGLIPLGLFASIVKRNAPGATDSDVLAAVAHLTGKHEGGDGWKYGIEGHNMNEVHQFAPDKIAQAKRDNVAMPDATGIHDAGLHHNGRLMSFLAFPLSDKGGRAAIEKVRALAGGATAAAEPKPAPAPKPARPTKPTKPTAQPAPVPKPAAEPPVQATVRSRGPLPGTVDRPSKVNTVGNAVVDLKSPAVVARGNELLARPEFRQALADAHGYQSLFQEHANGLVGVRRLFDEMATRYPGLTADDFHAALAAARSNWATELHILNETSQGKGDPIAVWHNDRLYNYVVGPQGKPLTADSLKPKG